MWGAARYAFVGHSEKGDPSSVAKCLEASLVSILVSQDCLGYKEVEPIGQ